MKRSLAAGLAGALFGSGLVLAGMTQPAKVIAFLDIFGDWDPSLAFVMVGAIAVHASLYRLTRARAAPLFADAFQVPSRRDVSPGLLLGSALFGVGWGMGGYCPGPALTSLPSGGAEVWTFVACMGAGFLLHRLLTPGRLASHRSYPGARSQ